MRALCLENFRCYPSLHLETEEPSLVLLGPNGAGKTNILEAVSLLSGGKGLRSSKLSEIPHWDSGKISWAVSGELTHNGATIALGIGVREDDEAQEGRRIAKINGALTRASQLSDWVSILWQTPQMDKIFQGGMSLRRQFLDRMVAGIFPLHNRHLHRFEYALRERGKLLVQGGRDPKWIGILEKTMAEESLAITSLRELFLKELNIFSQNGSTPFPTVTLKILGDVEDMSRRFTALEAEERIQAVYALERPKDMTQGGSASTGPHKTSVEILFSQKKGIDVCSTGEQKSILLKIVLSLCRLHKKMFERSPILLLDEVAAHLDSSRRADLFEELRILGVQSWLTGTDQHAFLPSMKDSRFYEVREGQVNALRAGILIP